MSNKKEKPPPAAALVDPVDFMVTLATGDAGREVSFHPEDVFVVDSAGVGAAGPASWTLVRLQRGTQPAQYNVPLPKAEVMRRIREKLVLLKAEHVIAGIRRQTVNDVVDGIGRAVIDQLEAALSAALDRELPERMRRFLIDFSRDEEEQAGAEAPAEARGTEAPP